MSAITSITASPPAAPISILEVVTVNDPLDFCVTTRFCECLPHENVNVALRSWSLLFSEAVKVTTLLLTPLVRDGVHHDAPPVSFHSGSI